MEQKTGAKALAQEGPISKGVGCPVEITKSLSHKGNRRGSSDVEMG